VGNLYLKNPKKFQKMRRIPKKLEKIQRNAKKIPLFPKPPFPP
jgi:hypothetical protein